MTDGNTHGPVSTIPRWFEFFRPLLEVLADGHTWQKRDMERAIVTRVGLTDEEIAETLSSGEARALNRIGWATSALRRAKALESPSRAHFRITDTGRKLLADYPGPTPEPAVYAIPAYSEYVPAHGRKTSTADPAPTVVDGTDPKS